jgi:hypothetical protein
LTQPILRPLADQLAARVDACDPLSLTELHQLAAAIRVAANLYEGVVLMLRRPGTGAVK